MTESKYTPPTSYYESWTNEERRNATLNAKAMNALYNVIDEKEYNKISTCGTTYEVWHALEILHKDTSKVKKEKKSRLVHKYELFKMIKGESSKRCFPYSLTSPML